MLDETQQQILDAIREYGWYLVAVSASPDGPGFVYTVGMMQTLDHPEIIMFGLHPALMAQAINEMDSRIRQGRRFDAPGLWYDVLKGYACRFLTVSEACHSRYLRYALWHRRITGQAGTLHVLQCLWPDRQGHFPDEPECDPKVIALQPLLDDRTQPGTDV